jgi:hypothetical protein
MESSIVNDRLSEMSTTLTDNYMTEIDNMTSNLTKNYMTSSEIDLRFQEIEEETDF